MCIYRTKAGTYQIKKWNREQKKMLYYGTYPTMREAQDQVDYLVSNGEITLRKRRLPKHIHMIHNRYYIYKNINGKITYFGCCATLEEAVRRRDSLIADDWKHDYVHRRRPYRKRSENLKYLTRTANGRWRVIKNNENYGTFLSLEDAMDERDYMKSIDWDYGNMW